MRAHAMRRFVLPPSVPQSSSLTIFAMPELTVNTFPRAGIPSATLACAVEDPAVDPAFRQYVRAHFAFGPILTACAVWILVFLFYAWIATPAHAATMPERVAASQPFSPVAGCQLVQNAGQTIAWSR
jgi:hypothetical protein